MKQSRTCRLLATALVAVLAACSDSATAPSSPLIKASGGPSRIVITRQPLGSVTPATATVASGGTQQFTAIDVTNAAIAPSILVWSMSGGGTIDATTGLFTAGTAAGTFTLTVVDTGFTTHVTVTSSVTVTVASTCKPHDERKECENERDHGRKGHGGKDHGGNRHLDRGHGGKNADQGHGGKNGDGHDRGHGG
jgi:hypothetical protein